jgi:hypothetical protein
MADGSQSPPPRARRRRQAALGALLAAGLLAGCGAASAAHDGATGAAGSLQVTTPTAAVPSPARRRRDQRVPSKSRGRPHSPAHGIAPSRASRSTVARVDAASDATLAEGEATVSAGAPSDAEVRREIEEAANDGIALPSGNTSASFAASVAEVSITDAQALAVGASVPVAAWNPARKPIADWIVPVLEWAYEHGWTGTVTSGYRTFQEQAELNAAGDFSAPAGTSNHESTEYPGGAVDVTEPAQLIAVLANYRGPEKLIGGVLGPVDPEHFSATGD